LAVKIIPSVRFPVSGDGMNGGLDFIVAETPPRLELRQKVIVVVVVAVLAD
jgi:hypothetical protein